MDKLSYMKSSSKKFVELVTPSKYLKQPKFVDNHLKRGIDFKHTWAQLAHMHDLRIWTITYAPSTKDNMRRL